MLHDSNAFVAFLVRIENFDHLHHDLLVWRDFSLGGEMVFVLARKDAKNNERERERETTLPLPLPRSQFSLFLVRAKAAMEVLFLLLLILLLALGVFSEGNN